MVVYWTVLGVRRGAELDGKEFLPLKIDYTEWAHLSAVVIKQFHMYLFIQ